MARRDISLKLESSFVTLVLFSSIYAFMDFNFSFSSVVLSLLTKLLTAFWVDCFFPTVYIPVKRSSFGIVCVQVSHLMWSVLSRWVAITLSSITKWHRLLLIPMHLSLGRFAYASPVWPVPSLVQRWASYGNLGRKTIIAEGFVVMGIYAGYQALWFS